MIKKTNLTFFSNSRSEFGLINQILSELKKYKKFSYKVVVSGTHFSKDYGNSVTEIKKSNVNYKKIFRYNTNTITEKHILKNLSLNITKLPKVFKNIDYAILFGDRIELLPIMINCLIYKKKIIHFGGGEETKGSVDNKVRKIISSVADFHFVSSQKYKLNLINSGIQKNKIFNVGTLSINKEILSANHNNKLLDINHKNLVSLTYHPVNIDTKISGIKQMQIILETLDKFKEEIFTIINAPGYEKDSEKVIKFIKAWVYKRKNFKFCKSLGFINYSNLIKRSKFLIGNSSSGVIMAPYFNIPSINIGSRQDGRIIHSSVINCKLKKKDIISAIKKIIYNPFKTKNSKFLLGKGDAAKKSIKILNRII